jgi:hypothetical protein
VATTEEALMLTPDYCRSKIHRLLKESLCGLSARILHFINKAAQDTGINGSNTAQGNR